MDEINNKFPNSEDESDYGAPLEKPHVTEEPETVSNTANDEVTDGRCEPEQNTVYQPDKADEPTQPSRESVYYPPGYNAPQNPWKFPEQPQVNNYAGYYSNGAPVDGQQSPADNSGSDVRNTNRKGRRAFLIVLAVVVVISAIAIPVSLIGRFGFMQPVEDTSELPTVNENAPLLNLNDTPINENTGASGDVLTPAQIYAKVAASNVAVMVYKNNQLYTEGTGIVMKEDDTGEYTYILTCAHVISDSDVELSVQMEDGTRYNAEMVGYDLRTDIGVVRIKASGLKAAEFGNSDSLKVGNKVYAVGNPGGSALFGTFTDGMVSAIGRSITSSIGYDMVCIQHNAAISPGNSGGALVNEYGQVIGINSSKIAATDFEGISFSIPITQAKDIINKILTYGYVPGRPKLGISYVENDSSQISGIYGMAVQMKELPSGSLVIYSIAEDSDLNNTQVKPGDMITAVNGKKLDTPDVLLEVIENSKVGDELELSIFRIESLGNRYNIEEFTVKVKLIEEK